MYFDCKVCHFLKCNFQYCRGGKEETNKIKIKTMLWSVCCVLWSEMTYKLPTNHHYDEKSCTLRSNFFMIALTVDGIVYLVDTLHIFCAISTNACHLWRCSSIVVYVFVRREWEGDAIHLRHYKISDCTSCYNNNNDHSNIKINEHTENCSNNNMSIVKTSNDMSYS